MEEYNQPELGRHKSRQAASNCVLWKPKRNAMMPKKCSFLRFARAARAFFFRIIYFNKNTIVLKKIRLVKFKGVPFSKKNRKKSSFFRKKIFRPSLFSGRAPAAARGKFPKLLWARANAGFWIRFLGAWGARDHFFRKCPNF